MAERKLEAIPLGGLGEFGMNILALRYGDDIVVIDAGMMFPEVELLGVDIVIPDISFLLENRGQVRALILTHCHEDHIGAVPFLLSELNLPVYGTAFTLAALESRLEEHGLLEKAQLNEVRPRQSVEIGPFRIEFIHVTHSTVACVMLAITTPLGVVIHTGDFKVDSTPTDHELFDLHTVAEYGSRGVLALFSDSTNVERAGYTPSERAVRGGLEEVFAEAGGRVLVSCFSSSIHRLQLVVDLACQFQRKIAFVGRSMARMSEIAHDMGYLHIPDGALLRPSDIAQAGRDRLAAVISGSQGEPMSALSRAAVDNHKQVTIEAGDSVVLSARIIPGNEKAIFRLVDHLFKRGAHVFYGDGSSRPVHVSGHASQEELKLMLNLVKPRFFVPIHGEYRQLFRHAELALHLRGVSSRPGASASAAGGLEQTFVLESGDVLEFDERGARLAGRVTVGRRCIDSGSIDEVVEDLVIRDRRHLSEDGIVLPILAINKHTGKVETPPEIVTRGFAAGEPDGFLERAREIVLRTLESSSAEEKGDYGVIKEKIRNDLKRFIHKQTARRPLILPVILEV
ncbi:MAG: ribonuclease J [Terriglobales bacterium]